MLPSDLLTPRSAAALPGYVCLAGPTGSGKTALAFALARHIALEVISVDSALVYRGMDIGTAKPSRTERAALPHHLIDIRDPLNTYSAAEFAADAKQLIGQIAARGKLALLVGGSMLYFKALREGLDVLPKADPALRQALAREAAQRGWPALHAELAKVDACTAARLAPADAQRISRALEVYRLSGQTLSSLQQRTRGAARSDASLLISLEPAERAWLHQRIAERFAGMLEAGFLDEVRALRARGDLRADLPAMRCVGYRQAWDYLDRLEASAFATAAPLSDLHERCLAATRQLAKRQLTWLRSIPGRCVVPCDSPDVCAQVLKIIGVRV